MTIDAIKQYIANTLLDGHAGALQDDQDLLMSGTLDSINVMKLAGYLEEQCGITIPAEDIVLENFSTIEQMHQYLLDRSASKGG